MLHIEKDLFAKLYEKVVGKPFSNKTTIVSYANLEKKKKLR
jgi:ribosomal protein L19E